jgi:hypothetical protein
VCKHKAILTLFFLNFFLGLVLVCFTVSHQRH